MLDKSHESKAESFFIWITNRPRRIAIAGVLFMVACSSFFIKAHHRPQGGVLFTTG